MSEIVQLIYLLYQNLDIVASMPITMQQIGNKLSEVYDLTAVRSVRIHDREGIEIDRIPS